MSTAFYNGILYQIEYKPKLSNNDYTQHRVYHIKTDDENYNLYLRFLMVTDFISGMTDSYAKNLYQELNAY